MIEFKTKFMQGFIASIEYMMVIKEVNFMGYCYTCPDDPRIRVNFPPGCIDKTTHMSFKVSFKAVVTIKILHVIVLQLLYIAAIYRQLHEIHFEKSLTLLWNS